mgnify:CR=1 FL=1
MANVGDVVLVHLGKHLALAVCNGGHALAPAATGLATVPMHAAVQAWRVG